MARHAKDNYDAYADRGAPGDGGRHDREDAGSAARVGRDARLTQSAAQASSLVSARKQQAGTVSDAPADADALHDGPRRGGDPSRARGDAGRRRASRNFPQATRKETLPEFIARNAVYIVGVAAVAAIAAVLLIAVKSCVPTSTYDYDGELDFDYQVPFDWELLDTSSDRYAYSYNGRVLSHVGIDVSENQGSIDWDAVKADGIEFAMIRVGYRGATEGDLYTDNLFEANLEGAKAAGVDCGVYFFSQAMTEKEARAEADFVVKQLGGTALEYPVAFDFEEAVAGVAVPRAAGLGKDAMSKIAEAFCKRVEKSGYQAMVYGNYYDLDLYHYDSLKDKSVWWAEYDVAAPNPHLDISMWQYANDGWVEGISTPVDMNIDLSDVL